MRILVTEQKKREIIELVKKGVSPDKAFQAVGIGKAYYIELVSCYSELQQDLIDKEIEIKDLDAFSRFVLEFMPVVESSELDLYKKAIGVIDEALDKGSVTSATWVLEHKYGLGSKNSVDINGGQLPAIKIVDSMKVEKKK